MAVSKKSNFRDRACRGKRGRRALQKEERQSQVSKLYAQGHSQASIAQLVGVSQQTVSRDLVEIRKRLWAEGRDDYQELVTRRLAELEQVRREAWDGFEKSKRDRLIMEQSEDFDVQGADTPAKTDESGAAKRNRRGRLRKIQSEGDPRWLGEVRAAIAQEAKILGLEARPEEPEPEDYRYKALSHEQRVDAFIDALLVGGTRLLDAVRARGLLPGLDDDGDDELLN